MGKPHPTLRDLPPNAQLRYQGKLATNAHHAVRPTDREGHFAPTLVLEIELPLGQRVHAEQFFPVGQDEACKAAAAKLRRGDEVAFTVSLAALRLTAAGVSSVEVVPPAPSLFEAAADPQPAIA